MNNKLGRMLRLIEEVQHENNLVINNLFLLFQLSAVERKGLQTKALVLAHSYLL